MTTTAERYLFEPMYPLFMHFLKDEWCPGGVMVWVPQPIMPFMFKRDIRSDLMNFHWQPGVPRGKSRYLDLLDDNCEAQRAA